MTPKQFLNELGISKKPKLISGSDEYLNEIKRAGFDLDAIREGQTFSPQAGDAFFCTVDVGRATLSGDYSRYRQHLQDLHDVRGFPENPSRIAEIGAGPGVSAIYFAKKHPTAQVTAFDWATRPLAVGSQLAREQKIPNISFSCESYEDLGNRTGQDDFDLVLSYYGFDLDPFDSNVDWRRDDGADALDEIIDTPPTIEAAAVAMARLLSSNGVGVFCGNWSKSGALYLFEAIRRAKLTVDWDITFTKGAIKDNVFVTNSGYVFVRRGLPSITANSQEDSASFFAGGEIDNLKLIFSTGAAGAVSDLFRGSRELVRIDARWKDQIARRVRLLHRSGLLLLEDSASSGLRRLCLRSLCDIGAQLQKVESIVAEFAADPDVKVRSAAIDSALAYLTPRFPHLSVHRT